MCVVIHAVGIPTNNWTLVQAAGHLCHLLGRLWMDMQMRRVQPRGYKIIPSHIFNPFVLLLGRRIYISLTSDPHDGPTDRLSCPVSVSNCRTFGSLRGTSFRLKDGPSPVDLFGWPSQCPLNLCNRLDSPLFRSAVRKSHISKMT